MLESIGLFLSGFALGLVIAGLGIYWASRPVDKLKEIEKRLALLEAAGAKRLPHKSALFIEQSLATLMEGERMVGEMALLNDGLRYWIRQAAEHARQARNGGSAAGDPNKPSDETARRASRFGSIV